jgi:hypothetical protein
VSVTSPALQGERAAATDGGGAYVIRSLPPGTYAVKFEFSGAASVSQSVVVPLGGVAELNVTLQIAAVRDEVTVVAELTPGPLATTQTSANFTADVVNVLPIGRRPFEIAELAPGVTDNTPNAGQMAIGGAFAFDSLFLVDGVDVNDNLFGTANALYVEDAIQETQVLTAGLSAEYGRAGGGVINVITKSGGNIFSGSFRTNFYRPSWTALTPFQTSRNQTNSETLAKFFEGTIGGPIVTDRLWFFNADRFEDSAIGRALAEVGTSYDDGTSNKRFELKLTGSPYTGGTVTGTYVSNPINNFNRPSINATMSMDPATLVDRQLPNQLWVFNWNSVVMSKAYATFQYSEKAQGFRNTGGTSTAITDSPFLSRGNFGIGATANRHFNAPYFSANDPEDRNNRQFAGSFSFFTSTSNTGRHDVKIGGEHFRSWRTGGNSQSATGYVFLTDYQTASGKPVVDADGHPIPVWTPSATGTRTRIQQWLAYPGSTLNINTRSVYVQDRWQINNRVTADLGLRYEDVKSDATGDIVGADTTAWLPRLGIAWDIEGNGRSIAQATYGYYSGRFTERAFARNTNVGSPSRVDWSYIGPNGVGRNFAPGFDLANYVITGGNFPTANVFFDPELSSSKTDEFTLAFGRQLRRGYTKVTYTWRRTGAFIEDFINDPTAAGKVNVVRDGVNYGTFDKVNYRNTDLPRRDYQALQFEGRADLLGRRFPVQGHYTVQLKNHGNFEGEAANQPGNPSIWLDYPEMFTEERYYPYGRLDEFQRHKFRLWTTYVQSLGRYGNIDISPLWRVNSGLTYSLSAASVGMSAIQMARNPGYARANTTTATLFFGERGTENFNGYGMLDVAVRYGVPVWKTVQPWIQAQVFNALNNKKLIQWNTTINPDPASPLDSIGQRTGYIKDANFGTATLNTHYPVWSSGESGSRTFRVAFGIRF